MLLCSYLPTVTHHPRTYGISSGLRVWRIGSNESVTARTTVFFSGSFTLKLNTFATAVAALVLVTSANAANIITDTGNVGTPVETSVFSHVTAGEVFSDELQFSLSSAGTLTFLLEDFIVPSKPLGPFAPGDILSNPTLSFDLYDNIHPNGNTLFGSGGVGSYTFNLAAGQYHIDFYGTTAGLNGGTYSASVSLAPVPEPETYAMMLAGLGALGFMARRRKSA
jgi:hypothetical protein